MKNSDNIFEKIDNYFDGKKNSEIALVFFLVFAFIAFISYSYAFPITEQKLKFTKRNLKAMDKKVQGEKNYLRSVTRNGDERFYIKKSKKELENLKIVLEKTTYTNAYVDNKLKELSYLLFNNQNWAKFLDSITTLAQKNHVKIKIIENKINEPSLQKIEQILNLKVEFNGNFKNVMKYINSIEESKLVVDIYEMDLKGASGIDGYINIAVWGMKY
jgi:lipopolysaccharide export LptBFGC system permease protein LptF